MWLKDWYCKSGVITIWVITHNNIRYNYKISPNPWDSQIKLRSFTVSSQIWHQSFKIQTSLTSYNQQMFVFRHLDRVPDYEWGPVLVDTSDVSFQRAPGSWMGWERSGEAGLYKLINLSGWTDSSVHWHRGVFWQDTDPPHGHTNRHRDLTQDLTELAQTRL